MIQAIYGFVEKKITRRFATQKKTLIKNTALTGMTKM